MELMKIYDLLLCSFGKQNWWPLTRGFMPKEFEVAVGAILTQNTSWKNAEICLKRLKGKGLTSPEAIAKTETRKLQTAIKSSGFYRQKAKRLREFSQQSLKKNFYKNINRENLLKMHGVGRETADSILLSACNKPFFVVDAYTKRVFSRIGIIKEAAKYDEIRNFVENNIPKNVKIYKEFHALIVELAKRYCRKKPLCEKCPLRGCRYFKANH
jgi:endonuclease-3 related protein